MVINNFYLFIYLINVTLQFGTFKVNKKLQINLIISKKINIK
jgi:hypothetical protein